MGLFKSQPLVLTRKDGLYLKQAGEKGRGLFCQSAIAKDEVIEITPILVTDHKTIPDDSLFEDYIFNLEGKISNAVQAWSGLNAQSIAVGLSMGLSSFCNHKNNPNAYFTMPEEHSTIYFTLKAQRDISADEEICIDYGRTWMASRRLQIST